MADKRYSTPVGTAVYPRLKNPDTKFNELGQYKSDLSLSLENPATKALLDNLLEDYKAHVGKAHPKSPDKSNRNAFYYVEEDEAGEPTGNIVLKLRVTNKKSRKTGEVWDRRPKQFDATLKPIDVNPWGGSKMAVSFEAYCWSNDGTKGFSLQPIGVQIIELVTGDGDGADSLGFAPTSGYTAPEDGSEGFRKPVAADTSDDDDFDGGDY